MSVSVLLVDDDPRRAEAVERTLRDRLRDRVALRVERSSCVHGAVEQMEHQQFDLLVLDLQLPLREDSDPVERGGVELLYALRRHTTIRLPRHIVGLTSFPQLAEQFRDDFGRDMWSVIRYEESSSIWVDGLVGRLEHIARAKEEAASESYKTDAFFVTALHEVELEAVLRLPLDWRESRDPGDDAIYYEGGSEVDGRRLRFGCAAATEMGMPATVALCMKAIGRFRPQYIVMCGIAAGVKGNFGDVLVADQAWDYGSGKREGRGASRFLPAPDSIPLSAELRYSVRWFLERRAQVLEDIRQSWVNEVGSDAGRRIRAPQVRIGPIASGASVVADKRVMRELIGRNRKLVGVEMEAYGVFVAARSCTAPRPSAFVAKSICDFGTARKDDRFQAYAAHTSAQFALRFVSAELSHRHGRRANPDYSRD